MKKAMAHFNRLAMKIGCTIKCALFFLIFGLVTANANSDELLDVKISLELHEATLLEAFKEIETKTSFTFFYRNEHLNVTDKITLKIVRKPVSSILDLLFEHKELNYTIKGAHIIVHKTLTPLPTNNTVEPLEINGRIIDQHTGTPIPFCNISIASSTIGSASNELGEFMIKVDSLPVQLVFSHLNYEKHEVQVTQTSPLNISLIPLTNKLKGVTVSGAKKDRYALELARNAYQKTTLNLSKSKYGKAFYRQKSKNGSSYSEFSEIIYDIRYGAEGIKDWSILEGRYALKSGGVHNKNFTLLSRLLAPIQPETDELVFPMHPDLDSFYDLRIIDYIESENQTIAVVWFKPKKNPTIPTFEAEVYIDTKTFDILKISGEITRDDLKLVRLAEKKSTWKDYALGYEIAYQIGDDNSTMIDYIKIDNQFDYYKNDSLNFQVTSNSILTFIEHYTPTKRKKLGGQFYKKRSDWENLNEIGYNKKFWEENPIVKRTGVEEEVISSFEADNAFGTLFLNGEDQISLMQNDIAEDPFIRELGTKVNFFNNYNPIEKVFLHTDKDLFSSGEHIWYSGYTVLGSYHNYSLASKVLHVDLISPDNMIVSSQTNEILDGRSSGSISLPKDLKSGNYQLRAYTQWMRNFDHDFFFTKKIKVLGDTQSKRIVFNDDDIDLQFFPEGGHMVNGLIGLVAFKAIGSDGKEKNIKGSIIDSKGSVVARLQTIDRGAGYFHIEPKAGEQYTAQLKEGGGFELPEALDQGYGMTITNVNPNSIDVKVQASIPLRDKSFYIVGHINNRKYYQGKFNFGEKSLVDFEIPKNWMPSGVLTLTLFDENKKPWCERIVFINNQEELVITAQTQSDQLEKRTKVAMDIRVTDTRGNPISTALSMSVTDAGQLMKNEHSGNILTHLLLQSDVKGEIESPGLFFQDQKRSTLHRLDLVMLTHGWRRFSWPEIKDYSPKDNKFLFAKGLPITGMARGKFDNPLRNKNMTAIAKSGDDIGMFSFTSDKDGKFLISNFNFKGPTSLVFKAFDKKRQLNLKMTLDSTIAKLPISNYNGLEFVHNQDTQEYSDYSDTRRRMDSLYEAEITTQLDEVVVTEKKIAPVSKYRPSELGATPDATVYTENNRAVFSLLHLVSLFPSVSVMGSVVSIRNQGTPLWVIDGIPVYSDTPNIFDVARQAQRDMRDAIRSQDGPGSQAAIPKVTIATEALVSARPVPTEIATMDTFSVERVEMLRGASAVIYGSRGANGVFLVYTKRGGATELATEPDFTVMGHANPREFYSPKYDTANELNAAPDHRATLYWNPAILTDEEGNANIEFYNSDSAEEIQIAIQGLSETGIPGTYLKTIGKED